MNVARLTRAIRLSSLWSFAASAILAIVGTSAHAFVFTENFNSGTLSTLLTVNADPGFGLSLAQGNALLSQAQGTGNGGIYITSNFMGTGDFESVVKANRQGSGAAQFGLGLLFPTATPQKTGDVFFSQHPKNAIWSNFGSAGAWASDGILSNVQDAVFRIRRVGNALYGEVDLGNGNGFFELNVFASNQISGPVQFALFFSQEFSISTANQGRLDDWTITAAGVINPVPEPSAAAMLAAGFLVLAAISRGRKSRG